VDADIGITGIGASSAQSGNIRLARLSEKGTRQRMNLERIPISSKRDVL
jgi:hypothetical protein